MSRLVAVLAHYGVEVNPDRVHQLVLCPFGHESNASCSLNLDKGVYNCFSCGEAGDELTLIQRKEHCDYASSVRRVIEIAGPGDDAIRGARRAGRPVPGGKGYRPRYKRAVPSGFRRNP